jgi:hypothetical protein
MERNGSRREVGPDVDIREKDEEWYCDEEGDALKGGVGRNSMMGICGKLGCAEFVKYSKNY